MKKLLPTLAALALIATACSDKPKQPNDNTDAGIVDTLAQDWDNNNVPMPLYAIGNYDENLDQRVCTSLRHIYNDQEDSAMYAANPANYHTLIDGSKQHKIRFTGEQKGQTMGYMLEGKYNWCMKGLNYEMVEGDPIEGIALTDDFLKTHEVLYVDCPSDMPSPKQINDSIEARYNMKVKKGYTCATSTDGTVGIYSIQMEPNGNQCLGLRVVNDNGKISVLEEWSQMYGEGSAWHVDDGDEYYPFVPMAVTRGAKGLDIFYLELAPESYSYMALLVREDSITNYCFTQYYVYYDFSPAPDPVALPDGSELKAESEEGYKVWIHTDVEPTEEEPAGVYSVYYLNPEDKQIYHVVTTGQNPEAYKKFNLDQPYIEPEDVQTSQEAYIIQKPGYSYCELILQGCPDSRNVMTYTITLPIRSIDKMFRWIRTNSGYQGTDKSGELLKFYNYTYREEGGRYNVCKYYDLDFNFVKEEEVEL